MPPTSVNQMSPKAYEIYKNAVTYILTEWPSLSLALDNGMGGSQAQEKRNWMCKTVAEVLINNPDTEVDDYIAEILDVEFNTVIEDGSLEYNAQWINKFYKDCLQGKEQEVLEAINKAAQKKQSLGNMRIPAPICQSEETSDEESGDDY